MSLVGAVRGRGAQPSRFIRALPLLLIVGFGLLVRLLGLRLGLPYFHHWDEVWVISSAQQMLEQGSDLPTSYQYGAPMSRLIVLVATIWEKLGLALPFGPTDEVFLRWVGRYVSVAICSSGTIAMYVAGRSAGRSPSESHRLGLYAALSYAAAYELVTHARYAVTDACLVTFVAYALACCGQYIRSRRLGWAAAAVMSAGLAFAFKPTAAPTVLLPLITLAFVRARSPSSHWAAIGQRVSLMAVVPAFVGCFLFFNPHYVDRWQEALRDLTMRVAQTKNGGFPEFLLRRPGLDHLIAVGSGLFGHTLSRHLWLSWPLTALASIGLLSALRSRRGVVLVGMAHAMAIVLLIALPNRAFLLRNYLVAVPAICLSLALGIEWLMQATRVNSQPRLGLMAPAIPVVALLAPSLSTLWGSIHNQRLAVDARERALVWIEQRTAGAGEVRVAMTPSVMGKTALGGHRQLKAHLERPNLRFLPPISTCPEPLATSPEYILSASYRGGPATWSPYVEAWHLQSCPGYREVASFEANPYEHTYWVTETWDGRASAIVLARESH